MGYVEDIETTYPTAKSINIARLLIPPPRYTPAAKIAWAIPRSDGSVKSERRLTLTGTHDPMKSAKPILGRRIPTNDSANDSKKVQMVQRMHAMIQIHLRG